MDIMDMERSVHEFCGLDLGDERLNRRLLGLAETFAAQPEAPINQACGDWQATKAAYAFFANPKTTPPAILAPHAPAGVIDPGHYLSELYPSFGDERVRADWR